jgi:hypothetical protein
MESSSRISHRHGPPLRCGDYKGETIIVVRHGDRDRASADQRLLPEGENRSREIGKMLRHQRIDLIFYTRDAKEEPEEPEDWVRCCQTAEAIRAGFESAGGATGIKPQAMPRLDEDKGELLVQWLMGKAGTDHPHVAPTDHAAVLVMHHEEIRDLVDCLTNPADPKSGPHIDVAREDYDNVFVLTRTSGEEKFSLVRLAVTPAPAAQPAATQPADGCECHRHRRQIRTSGP